MKKIFLFDLDSTLLQMDQDLFLKKYFSLIYVKAKSLGFEPEAFMQAFNKMAIQLQLIDRSVESYSGELDIESFLQALCDDLNTPNRICPNP